MAKNRFFGFGRGAPSNISQQTALNIDRVPNSGDTNFDLGQIAVYEAINTGYMYLGNSGGLAQWQTIAASGGALQTLTGDSGTATPSANNIQIAGTSNEISTIGSGAVITLSIPSAFIAPGSIASTTTLTAGSTLTVTTNATIGGTLGVTGTTSLAAVSATNATLSGTLGVTGLSTLGALTVVGTTNINHTGNAATTIGNASGSGAITVNVPSGNMAVTGNGNTINYLTDANASTFNFGSSSLGNATFTIASGSTFSIVGNAGTILIGNDSNANVITLGSASAGAVSILSGTSIAMTTGAAEPITINSNTGALGISTDAHATTISIGTGAAVVKTIAIGGTGANVITLADTQTAGSLAIGNAMTTGTISIGSTVAGTGTATLFSGTGAQTINLANNTGIKTINIAGSSATAANIINVGTASNGGTLTMGSTTGTATTVIQSGSGGITATGVITASSNVLINGAASYLGVHHGAATDFCGTGVTLSSGTVTVANTNIATGDIVMISRTSINGSTALGVPIVTISNGASFTVTSVIIGMAGSTQTADNSIFSYVIIRPI